MRFLKIIFICVSILYFWVSCVGAEIFIWTDKKGVKHYTNRKPSVKIKNLKIIKEVKPSPEVDAEWMKRKQEWMKGEETQEKEEAEKKEDPVPVQGDEKTDKPLPVRKIEEESLPEKPKQTVQEVDKAEKPKQTGIPAQEAEKKDKPLPIPEELKSVSPDTFDIKGYTITVSGNQIGDRFYVQGQIRGGPECARLSLTIMFQGQENKNKYFYKVFKNVGNAKSQEIYDNIPIFHGKKDEIRWKVKNITVKCKR